MSDTSQSGAPPLITAELLETLAARVREYEEKVRAERLIWDNSNPESRVIWKLDQALKLLDIAARQHRNARLAWEREGEAEAIAAQLRALRAPPDLQQLVIEHGGYDRITADAWARFDAEMALWRERMRNGDFSKEAIARQTKYADRREVTVLKQYAT